MARIEGALVGVSSSHREWAKTFREDALVMEAVRKVRKVLKTIGINRAFAPGRLGPQRMAAAYERLVPIRRVPVGQEPQVRRQNVREEYLCAQ